MSDLSEGFLRSPNIPLSEPLLAYFQLDPVEFNQTLTGLIHENELEDIICEVPAILSRPRCIIRVFMTFSWLAVISKPVLSPDDVIERACDSSWNIVALGEGVTVIENGFV